MISKSFFKWLVITGTLVICLIKFLVRPFYPGNDGFLFFLNIAPNLLGSFLIPFGVYWLYSYSYINRVKWFKMDNRQNLVQVCMAGFLLLVINEYLQKIPLFGRTFDYNDILFSAIGFALSYILFLKVNGSFRPTPG